MLYKVDTVSKRLTTLKSTHFSDIGVRERYDVQEWIHGTPEILGEDLLIIAKELPLSPSTRLDLLAIDRQANLVIIELKRDDSGNEVEWQAIKYASYCSNFTPDDIVGHYSKGHEKNTDEARADIERFIETDLDSLNQNQRIILVARKFHSDVVSAVLWLRDYYLLDIKCVRLRSYVDHDGELFITPDIIIPLPEAKDYIERKEVKQRDTRERTISPFSLEVGAFELSELERRLRETFNRPSELTPRFVHFIEILLSEERVFNRDEIKQALFARGVGADIGYAGRLLSGISQFLTKKSNPHLRQVIEFESGGDSGEVKRDYRIVPEYRPLLQKLTTEWHNAPTP